MSQTETTIAADPAEISDTRRAAQSEIDRLRAENTRVWEKVFNLESELSDRDTALALLKAQVARQADQIKKYASLDNHSEASPL